MNEDTQQVAKLAVQISTFYNHLTLHSVPDEIALQITAHYMTCIFGVVAQQQQGVKPESWVDRIIKEAIKRQQDNKDGE